METPVTVTVICISTIVNVSTAQRRKSFEPSHYDGTAAVTYKYVSLLTWIVISSFALKLFTSLLAATESLHSVFLNILYLQCAQMKFIRKAVPIQVWTGP
jgi:hypothetical protein